MNIRFGYFSDLNVLEGRTFDSVYKSEDEIYGNDCIVFYSECGQSYVLGHRQSCCESVTIEDIDNDLSVLTGVPINMAYESYNSEESGCGDSETWSFYRFGTEKAYVAVRFYGTSNGYYSERAELCELENDT